MVSCPCNEISIDGGTKKFRAAARDFKNFVRIDDEGNEVAVTLVDKPEPFISKEEKPLVDTYADKLAILMEMIDEAEKEHEHMSYANLSKREFAEAMLVIYSLLKDVDPSASEDCPASP